MSASGGPTVEPVRPLQKSSEIQRPANGFQPVFYFVSTVFDRLITRDVDGTVSHHVYDGQNIWADFDATGAVVARYLHGPGIDNQLARWWSSGGTAWYLTDHLGSVRDIMNNSATIINSVMHNSFGQILSETSPANGDRFKFTGREWESSLDLFYYRARFFDPATGRFTQTDPIGFDAGDGNLYRYVFNSPTNFIDPT